MVVRFLVDATSLIGGVVDVVGRAAAIQARQTAVRRRKAPHFQAGCVGQLLKSNLRSENAESSFSGGRTTFSNLTSPTTQHVEISTRARPPALSLASQTKVIHSEAESSHTDPTPLNWQPLAEPEAVLADPSLLRNSTQPSPCRRLPETHSPTSAIDSLWLSEKQPLSSPLLSESTDGAARQTPSPAASDAPFASPAPQSAVVTERERFSLQDVMDSEVMRPAEVKRLLRPSKVPSSRLGRLFHYGGLAAGLSWGAASEAMRRSMGGHDATGESVMLSEKNVTRLVDKLSRMRGAALKLGQFMSIQDAKVLPLQVEEIFLRVQNAADYMPAWQTEASYLIFFRPSKQTVHNVTQNVMSAELGPDWRKLFEEFSDVPLASASIGQVHAARIAVTPSRKSVAAAVKIQFPGVYDSISSDLSYLRLLVTSSAILPKGLFLENTMKVLGEELRDECDYKREAWCGKVFAEFLRGDSAFRVPKIFDDLSTGLVLTTEYMSGTPLTRAARWPQRLRDQIGYDILKLCLREILHFRFMQTDPNWTNFLWNWETQQLELIDFGASQEYSETFVGAYLDLFTAAIEGDWQASVDFSRTIGYLTGDESEVMISAHVDSLMALAEPFRLGAGAYSFAGQTITNRVKAHVPVMLQHRLTPPPKETYSLNRKLSGAFLLCSRLGSTIECRELFESVVAERRRWVGEGGEREIRMKRAQVVALSST